MTCYRHSRYHHPRATTRICARRVPRLLDNRPVITLLVSLLWTIATSGMNPAVALAKATPTKATPASAALASSALTSSALASTTAAKIAATSSAASSTTSTTTSSATDNAEKHTAPLSTATPTTALTPNLLTPNLLTSEKLPLKKLPLGALSYDSTTGPVSTATTAADIALADTAQISATTGVRDLSPNDRDDNSDGSALSTRTSEARDSHFFYSSYPLITDVSLTLWDDPDDNGFYSRFSLTFDIDADRYHRAVFARVYLKTNSGRYRLFHTTTHFALRGWAVTDYYEMDATLLSEYGSDWYDIRIELFDATTGTLYDSLDAHSHYALFSVPLEARRDYHGNLDVFIQASVGSFGTPITFLLLLTLLYRRKRYP